MKIKSNSHRILINTCSQYSRTVINIFLSLYSTRLILNALGVTDYGIFTLIAGVVTMLAFITNAMSSTTQRFISYYQSKSDFDTQQKLFNNSIILHIFLGIVVIAILEILGLFIFNGFLNIIPERIHAAKIVYQCVVSMIILSFLSSPYQALIISNENIVFSSLISVMDGVLLVITALLLNLLKTDKLILYGYLMLGINIFNLIAFVSYVKINYKTDIIPKLKQFDLTFLRSMGNFVGWQLYITGCIIGRTQGTAIVLNKFFGSVINASFGIALQISGAINVISSSLMTAVNPQLVKAEGCGDRLKMFTLAESASKIGFLLLAALVIPVFFQISEILKLWLGENPPYSSLFCQVILITSLIDQLTLGLASANQAIGNIKWYALSTQTLKILTVPLLAILLLCNIPLKVSIWCYLALEIISSFLRLPFLKKTGGLKVLQFIKNVFCRPFIPVLIIILIYSLLKYLNIFFWTYIIYACFITVFYIILVYKISLTKQEQIIIINIIASLKNKLNNFKQ